MRGHGNWLDSALKYQRKCRELEQKYSDLEQKYKQEAEEAEKMKNELVELRPYRSYLDRDREETRDITLHLASLADIVNHGIANLNDNEQSLREYLVQVSEACVALSEFGGSDFSQKIDLARQKLESRIIDRQTRTRILEEQKAENIKDISDRFSDLVRKVEKDNVDIDVKILEPFLIRIGQLISATRNNREKDRSEEKVPELVAAENLIGFLEEVRNMRSVVQRFSRLRESGFYEKIVLPSADSI
jgi:dGTP triphosphohydrolase